MPDVVIGNVILTVALAIALLLFVAASSGISLIYTVRTRGELLQSVAEQIAQIIQQSYLVVNNSEISVGSNVTQVLGLPVQIAGYGYTIVVKTSPLLLGNTVDKHVTVLTVTIALTGTYGSASSSVLLGSNVYWYTQTAVTVTQGLGLLLDKCAGVLPNHPICQGYDVIGFAFLVNSKAVS
ncbi:hypothetical protein B9Q11_03470 [Candidatus Marsarchaeota G2 archaeon ECH_B_SAG-F08]|jgi:hypothetical protein|uniref:Uncharacterized protein n=5 Tax=Candidatus Marsarchaeota TaxID=1978152 RepID=A0A2R6ADG7_9ARCH|nr:MAG: hypothetical protein B9Q01_08895 [Candidatus Marsarchaeota G1 archaeon OSP_D]PSN84388.1 MAG: hypothetical protein B9Q02_09565 [Candidatus Marsarchaeota G1 archaeon BE_D]PSN88719.1 MAG: hypothetical protein B9Q00_04245 [Candidatus Marsarchaeota G1 archaeon OSP_C]PSN93738.1 MAG: hypothetical protein B9P99_02185 [Candidatus Marsarchaeota G1 archaeon OSP_B]PSN97804.1 MAG: hypothetical protein B9Q11_03470 [Candidatus Marsarchaeota G2 archaeon ECH_B_SAG-F08]